MNELYRQGATSNLKIDREYIALLSETENLEEFFYIDGITTLDYLLDNRVLFIDNFSTDILQEINNSNSKSCLFILPEAYKGRTKKPCLICSNPRQIFAELVNTLFQYDSIYWIQNGLIDSSANIDSSSELMQNVSVGKNSTIGRNTIIFPNVVIGPNCFVGDNVIIKSNTVIGQAGFGIYQDDKGYNQHLPHVGGVIIEDNVEIGAINTVVSGTIHPTVVEKYVKTDDHVHIAHNDYISSGVQIAAHALLSGSVYVGENAWLGPNITIIDHVDIGKDSFYRIRNKRSKGSRSRVYCCRKPC